MTPELRQALIDLWRDVPGCRPKDTNKVGGDALQDAANGAMLRWLASKDAPHDGHGGRPVIIHRAEVNGGKWSVLCGGFAPYYAPTLTEALIAAVRATAKKGGGE